MPAFLQDLCTCFPAFTWRESNARQLADESGVELQHWLDNAHWCQDWCVQCFYARRRYDAAAMPFCTYASWTGITVIPSKQ